MKKLLATFISVLMLAAVCLPGAAIAAAPQLGVTIGEIADFAKGDVSLPIVVKNNGAAATTISRVDISGGSFSGAAYTSSFTLAAGAQTTIYLPVKYTGSGKTLALKFTAGSDVFNTNLVVSNATETSVGGGGNVGGDDIETKVDAEIYIAKYDTATRKAGTTAEFPMTLGSAFGRTGYDVRMSLTGPKDYENKFSFRQNGNWYLVDSVSGDTRIKPQLIIDASVPDGRYDLTVNFQYTDGSGNSFKITDTVVVNVFGRSETLPYINSANFAVAEIDKTNKARLDVNIMNPMAATIWDVSVSYKNTTEGITLSENFLPVKLNSINARQMGMASFSMYVSKDAGNYPLSFDIAYRDAGNQTHTITATVNAEVHRAAGAGSGDASVPRIIIQSYQTDVEVVQAGQSFILDFTLQNTSATEAVSNIKVTLTSMTSTGSGTNQVTNDIFFPSAGSNSFFIEKIGAKQSVSQRIELMTSQSVEQGVYPIFLEIGYDSEAKTGQTSKEQISLPVVQEQRLDIQNFQVSPDAMVGDAASATGQYINMGKSTIYNFSIGLEGDFTMGDGFGYIGNLTSGYNDEMDVMFTPNKEGSCKGAILFNYEDSQGNPKSQKQEFTINVSAGGGMGGGEMNGGGMGEIGGADRPSMGPGPDEPAASPISAILLWGGIGVIVAACIVIAVVIVRKKRRAQKALVDDEED